MKREATTDARERRNGKTGVAGRSSENVFQHRSRRRQLGELVRIIGGGTPSRTVPAFWGGDIPWATVKDFSSLELSATQETITREGLDVSASNLIPAGRVIMPTRMGLGRAAINTVPIAINQDLKALECCEHLDPRYLLRWVIANAEVIERMGAGATVKGITLEQLTSLVIPLPPLPEQRRIAAILDKADAIRRKRRETIRLTDDFLRSVFLDMFGDPVTNPKGWPVSTVGEETTFITSGSRGWAQHYAVKGALFIRIQNLKSGVLDLRDIAYVSAPDNAEARRTRVQGRDVLLSITADLGRTAVVPDGIGEAYINQHLAILRFATLNPVFVSHQLATPGGQSQFRRLNRSAVKAGLNFEDIRSLSLLNPPADLQDEFERVIVRTQTLSAHTDESNSSAAALFDSLSQRAFKGEL